MIREHLFESKNAHLQGDEPQVSYRYQGRRKDGSPIWQETRHAACILPLPNSNNLLPPAGPQ